MNEKNPSGSSAAETTAAQGGAQTGGTQSGAGSEARQAGAQTGQAQAGSGAAYQSAGAEVTSDVGQAEAYLINMKRLVENALSMDAQLQQILLEQARRLSRNAETSDTNVNKLSLDVLAIGTQSVANNASLANRVNNLAIDLDTRIKSNAIDNDGRRAGNDEQYDKAMDSLSQSERERTLRGGDAGDVIRWSALSENPIMQDAISAAVAKEVQKSMAAAAPKA